MLPPTPFKPYTHHAVLSCHLLTMLLMNTIVFMCTWILILQCTIAAMLWNGAFVGWVGHLSQYTINLDLWTDCKLGFFLHEFAAQYSSMLLAIMSIEKFFALYFPLNAKSYCTIGTAKWVSSILALVIGGLNFPIFIWYKSFGRYCYVMKHFNYFLMLNTLFYTLIPIFSMLLANAAIICKLMEIKYKGISRENQSVSKSSTRGSVMVVTVSLAFIILTCPRTVDNVIKITFSTTPLHSLLVLSMQYLNHSINGILYCIFGEKFRNELGKMILSCRKKRMSETSMNSVTTDTTTPNPL